MTQRTIERAAVGAVLAPFLVLAAALIAGAGDYLPVSDHALIEMKLRDIGRHPVWTGLYSRNDWSHPGPLFFYLVWPIYRLGASASIAVNVAAVLINAASVVGMAVVARRRGGTPLLLVTLAACALLVRTLGVDFVGDPWNTYVTVLPFGLLVFLVWAMTCGETWALPVGAITATYLAQTHIGFVVLALPLFAGGAAWLVATKRTDVSKVAAWTAALIVLLWLPLLGSIDNLRVALEWFRHAEDGTHTLLEGWRVASDQLTIPPEWLTTKREPSWITGEPVALSKTPLPWLLLALAAAAWWSRTRNDVDGLKLLAVFGGAFVLTVIAVWRTVGLAFDYRLRWTWVIGMIAAVVLARAASTWQRRATTIVAAASIVVASTVSAVVALDGETPRHADTDVLAAMLPDVLDAIGDERDGQVVIDDGGDASAIWYTRSLVLLLERRGIDARMPAHERHVVGRHRIVDGDVSHTFVVAVDDGIDPGRPAVAEWSSVSDEDLDAIERRLARIEDPIRQAKLRHDEGPQTRSEAVAWRVAVYETTSQNSST
jgi:hypothetical protein